MSIRKIHHVAYRCKDARATAEWYEKHLGMKLVLAIAEDQVPSTKAPDPYMHLFMDAGGGNILAFFEIPNSPPMGRDENTPEWVQHIAFEVESVAELEATRDRLQAAGIDVVGVTDHTIFKSIYFFDPNGHRLELAANTGTPDMYQRLDAVKWDMVMEWDRTKKAPKHAAWMHEKEFA
ncbi:VOC family protein [Ramlibacter sp.]|uniref:VOC family protein n=1 Tax=Ramlibacter sp. TaxID=1917967 RepID=UPI0035AE14A5